MFENTHELYLKNVYYIFFVLLDIVSEEQGKMADTHLGQPVVSKLIISV